MCRSFFRFITIHAFERRADGRTDGHLAHGYTAAATCIPALFQSDTGPPPRRVRPSWARAPCLQADSGCIFEYLS